MLSARLRKPALRVKYPYNYFTMFRGWGLCLHLFLVVIMYIPAFKMPFGIFHIIEFIKWKIAYYKEELTHAPAFGSTVFCGSQGSGKTLSAVQYVEEVFRCSPRAILVTNVALNSFPVNAYMCENGDIRYISNDRYCGQDYIGLNYNKIGFKKPVIQYTGLEQLTKLKNGKYGIIYLIDEFHLELNSLESKNIPLEIMTELSQQRKQRIHIVGTSQVFMRLAKPLREQIANVVLCKNYLSAIQVNKMALGDEILEKDGEVKAKIKAISIFLHQPKFYAEYDTYAKMKRYTKLWRENKGNRGVNTIYEQSNN